MKKGKESKSAIVTISEDLNNDNSCGRRNNTENNDATATTSNRNEKIIEIISILITIIIIKVEVIEENDHLCVK